MERRRQFEPERNPDTRPTEPRDPRNPLRRWEALVERQIREAQEAGAFDNLPHQGRRLPLEDDSAAGDRASGFRIMRNAGVAPGWIEADKEIRALLVQRDDLLRRAARSSRLMRDRYRRELTELVDRTNRAVMRLNHEAPTLSQHRRPLILADEQAALERPWAGDADESPGAAGTNPDRPTADSDRSE